MSENAIQQVGSMDAATVETVLIGGDLSKLTPEQRLAYYSSVCKSLGLNALTKPFEFITLNNKLTLYARRDCTDQLRSIKGISIVITNRTTVNEVYIVTAQANEGGRTDESTGAVSIKGLSGEMLANAMMKAETKAKRRVTLSIAGLGMLDEAEIESVPQAKKVEVNMETGEIVEPEFVIPEPPVEIDPEVIAKILPGATLKELTSTMYEVGKKGGKSTGAIHELFKARFSVDRYQDLSELQLREMIFLLWS
jgi:hypothetical protein